MKNKGMAVEDQLLSSGEVVSKLNNKNSVESNMVEASKFKPHYGTAYDSDEDENGFIGTLITILSYIFVFITLPISIWGCIKVVQEYERAVIFRLGRLRSGRAKGPGLFFIVPCIDNYRCVDLRTGAFDVPPQEILTRDSVTISVDAVVYYQVSNPLAAICNNDDYNRSTRLLAATTLRNVMGTKNLSEILSDREAMGKSMHQILEEATDVWGVHVDRVEVKDVRLPQQMQRSMAAEAEASRDARAKVISSEGEQKSAKALKEAADTMAQSPTALQLRYLQSLHSISAEKNSTIIFPLPMELLGGFMSPDSELRRRFTGNAREN